MRVSTDDFVTKVAISDMMEIQSSQLALDRQPDADTKPFAESAHDLRSELSPVFAVLGK
jgi:hypothetical protein